MALRKRTTTKTGPYSRRTTSFSSKGITQSFSSKPPGAASRRTVSYSNGKVKTTYSSKTGGGYTDVISRTQTVIRKPRVRRSRRKKGKFSWFWFFVFVLLLIIIF